MSAVLLVAERITPFVASWSTMTKIASNPSHGGRSVMKLVLIVEKGQASFAALISIGGGVVGCVLGLCCWHWAHPATYSCMKFLIPGHQ